MSRLTFASVRALDAALRTPQFRSSCSKWFGNAVQLRKLAPHRPVQSSQARGALCFSTVSNLFPTQPKADVARIFADRTFYKGKSALTLKPGKPVFKARETGDLYLEKEGCLFMQFAPAVAERQYDWNRKQIIALSVVELGTLMGLLSSEGCEFFHDPNLGKSDAGMVRKALKVEPMPDKAGFFFNLTVVNKIENLEERFNVPVTKAEFAVMRSSFNFIIPYLMGWHAFVNPSLLDRSLISGDKQLLGSSMADPAVEWLK